MTFISFRFIACSILVLVLSSVSAQHSNPFEVVHTKKYLGVKKNVKQQKTLVEQTIDQKVNTEQDVDNTNISNKDRGEKKILETKIDDKQAINHSIKNTSNPFDVEHDIQKSESSKSAIEKKSKPSQITDKLRNNNNNPFEVNGDRVEKSKKENHKNIFDTRTSNKSNPNPIIKQDKTVSEKSKILKTSPTFKNEQISSNFIFWVILFTLFLFAILINYKRQFVLKSYRGILNENYLKLIKREEQNGFSLFFLSLFFVFSLSLSSFIYLTLKKIWDLEIGFNGFVYVFLAILVVYIIRLIIMKFIGYVFGLELATEKYFFIILYYNILLGISLLVVNTLLAFGTNSIVSYGFYIGIAILGLLVFIRSIRGLLIAIQQRFLLKIHFIFYLCAVEIAPVLISLKLLEDFG